MSKPKTKGEPISLRFPLEADAKLRRKAAARDMTPAQYLVSRISASLGMDTP